MKPIDLSVVIPCYCSGLWLEELVRRIEAALQTTGQSYEIILVNDASPDSTWSAIAKLAQEVPTVRGIDLHYNVGQYRATLCGMEQARGRWIVTMDDDFQHPPEQLPALIHGAAKLSGWDCVMARFPRKHHSILRNAGSRMIRWLYVRFYGAPRNIVPSSFRVLTAEFARVLCAHRTANPVLCPLIFQMTSRVANVEVQHAERAYGKSGYRWSRLIGVLFDTLLRATTYPLHAISLLGLTIAVAAFLFGVYRIIRFFFGPTVLPGFTTLAVLITFFGGMILFAIGLVGEYLARVIEEVRGKPRYVIRQTVGNFTNEVKSAGP